MKTKKLIALLVFFAVFLTAQTSESVQGDLEDLPTSITESGRTGGWINTAVNDDEENIFVSQSDLIHTVSINGSVEIISSINTLGEAKSMNFENDRVVCCYFNWPETNKNTITTFEVNNETSVESFQYGSISNGIYRLELINGYLYVAENAEFSGASKIYIFDWTAGPNSDNAVGEYNPDNANIYDFTITGSSIFLVGSFNGEDKLVKVNISDKSNPVEEASILIENITTVGYYNGYVYAGCSSNTGNDGLKVLQASDPTTIVKEAFRALIDFDKIIVDGSNIYARDGKNVIVIDISDEIDPVAAGQQTFGDFADSGFEIWGIAAGKIYYTNNGKFGTIDATSVNNILLGPGLISPRVVIDQDIDNGTMVVIDDLGDIFSYGFTEPGEFVLQSTGNINGAQKVFIYNGDCYIANNSNGIHIFDVSDVETQIGHYTSQATAMADFVDLDFGGTVCFAIGGANLEIFHLTQNVAEGNQWPRQPLAQVELSGTAAAVFLDGNNLYVANGSDVSVYDVQTPSNPTLQTTISLDEDAVGLAEDGSSLIVCSIDMNSTYLSAYDNSRFPPVLLKKEQIADTPALSESKSNVMEFEDGLILVIVENRLLTYIYDETNNVFTAGIDYEGENSFENIKTYSSESLSKLSKAANAEAQRKVHIFLGELSYGLKQLKALLEYAKENIIQLIEGYLTIDIFDGGDITVSTDSEGYLTINGIKVLDIDGNFVSASDVLKFHLDNQSNADNAIDITDVNSANFPGPSETADVTVTLSLGNGNETVNAGGDLNTTIRGNGGNDKVHLQLPNSGAIDLEISINLGVDDDLFEVGLIQPSELTKLEQKKNQRLWKNLKTTNAAPDTIADESGIDTLDFSGHQINHNINLDLLGVAQTIDDSGWTVVFNGQFENYYGSSENDVITVKPLDVPRFVDGGENENGDTLIVDSDGLDAVDYGTKITIEGFEPITYSNFSEVIIEDVVTEVKENTSIPTEYGLSQNYPNPFNPSTSIEYQVSSYENVTIKVYDILGNEIKTLVNEKKSPGTYNIVFNAEGVSSGVYFYRMVSKSFVETKKMLLLR
ncbi:MAG: T9SS type A sorting domain-containing protein [Ignavibacteria bacterium]